MINKQMQRQVNEQTEQDKSKINKDFKINPHYTCKINQETDYFIVGKDMEANSMASTKTTDIMHNEYSDVLW